MGKNSHLKIPQRWEPYTPLGDPIAGTRFVSFKVPLKVFYHRTMRDEIKFGPADLVQKLSDKGLELGLVVDLTFTDRYYDSTEVTERGIQFHKIKTVGHQVPSEEIMTEFSAVVQQFLEENADNEKLIGVHCTHGVNRTGYMICRYMIDKLNFEPDAAIEAFNKARGHELERENYLCALRGGTPEEIAEIEKKMEIAHGPSKKHFRPKKPRKTPPPPKVKTPRPPPKKKQKREENPNNQRRGRGEGDWNYQRGGQGYMRGYQGYPNQWNDRQYDWDGYEQWDNPGFVHRGRGFGPRGYSECGYGERAGFSGRGPYHMMGGRDFEPSWRGASSYDYQGSSGRHYEHPRMDEQNFGNASYQTEYPPKAGHVLKEAVETAYELGYKAALGQRRGGGQMDW